MESTDRRHPFPPIQDLLLYRYSPHILSEKSPIWPIIFDLLNKNVTNTDLASAIKATYNLHNSRKTEHPDFLHL